MCKRVGAVTGLTPSWPSPDRRTAPGAREPAGGAPPTSPPADVPQQVLQIRLDRHPLRRQIHHRIVAEGCLRKAGRRRVERYADATRPGAGSSSIWRLRALPRSNHRGHIRRTPRRVRRGTCPCRCAARRVQVNGKTRSKVQVARDADEETVGAAALRDAAIHRFTERGRRCRRWCMCLIGC